MMINIGDTVKVTASTFYGCTGIVKKITLHNLIFYVKFIEYEHYGKCLPFAEKELEVIKNES